MDVAVLFSRFGPYHVARLAGAGAYFQNHNGMAYGIEVAGSDEANHYYWKDVDRRDVYEHITLAPNEDYSSLARDRVADLVHDALTEIRPDAVAINGWSFAEARAALNWCRRTDTPRILMSTSQYFDYSRSVAKEFVKRGLVAPFHSGFVGGKTHQDYLVRLGMDEDNIVLGYNAVDNDYFREATDEVRASAESHRARLDLPESYFLVVGRMVPEKNLHRLIEAYDAFRDESQNARRPDLVILGDGPLRSEIETLVEERDLSEHIHFPGFVQYDELPAYYALAYALLLPSVKDTWGLVVNEAIASGLPVLVSDRCGCAPHLVNDGTNGFVISPEPVDAIREGMTKLAALSATDHESMAKASASMIEKWGPQRFAEGLWQAAEIACQRAPHHSTPLYARMISTFA